MSRREQILIIVGLAVVVVLGFYYIVYQPRQTEYRALVAEQQELTARHDEMVRVAAQTEQLERRYAELQTFIATIEAKLPTEKEVPALLVQLEQLTTRLRVDLRALRPGALEAVTSAAQPQGAQPGQTGQGQAPAQGRPEYFRFPIGMTFTATYDEFVSLMGELRDFPRLIAVMRVTLTPGTLPELGVQADTETYVLPKEAR